MLILHSNLLAYKILNIKIMNDVKVYLFPEFFSNNIVAECKGRLRLKTCEHFGKRYELYSYTVAVSD